jgi:importin-9
MAQDIGPFMLVTSEDTLALVLDTLSVVMQIEKATWLTTDLASSLVKAILQVWSHHNKGTRKFHRLSCSILTIRW